MAVEKVMTLDQQGLATLNEELRKTDDNINALKFRDRGDPAAYDYAVGALTTDGTWRDLDLSSTVQEKSRGVMLGVTVEDGAAESAISFRKKGNSNEIAVSTVSTQAADVPISADIIVACDTDRKIQYKATNTTFTTINIVVKGWWR